MIFREPSIRSRSFSCPYCGAHADQTWYDLSGNAIRGDKRTPFLPGNVDDLDFGDSQLNADVMQQIHHWAERVSNKEIFFEEKSNAESVFRLYNVNVSRCYSCSKIALWHHHSLIHPNTRIGASPNADLNDDIRADIDEARSIISLSPRGAAALLRLAVQKLCKQLGEPGKDINQDIQGLVTKGMDPHLQQAFDAVRVVGNEAVHPGELDLRDDRDTALLLIDLINIVAQELLTNKKSIASIYDRLPTGKLGGIQARARAAADKSSQVKKTNDPQT
jgi:hypothetical protein